MFRCVFVLCLVRQHSWPVLFGALAGLSLRALSFVVVEEDCREADCYFCVDFCVVENAGGRTIAPSVIQTMYLSDCLECAQDLPVQTAFAVFAWTPSRHGPKIAVLDIWHACGP